MIGESGDRVGALVTPGSGAKFRDTAPAFSPDGKWVVFASSRGRPITDTSLWAVRVGYDATPVRITDDKAIDTTPAWLPAGDAIVFASSRGGDLDLWRLPVVTTGPNLRAAGPPERLTSAKGQEVSPTVAPDGRIAYQAIVDAAGQTTSRIEVRAPDGSIKPLTKGPGDSAPRYSPDGNRLAFARPTMRKDPQGNTGVDTDLWVLDRDGEKRVIDIPLTDESGPVWSIDGRWLFGTSLIRKVNNDPLLSSVIHVDLSESEPTARMLVDSLAAVTRLTPAVAPVVLDATALKRNPSYVEELPNIIRRAIKTP